jgi:hypothetical protein
MTLSESNQRTRHRLVYAIGERLVHSRAVRIGAVPSGRTVDSKRRDRQGIETRMGGGRQSKIGCVVGGGAALACLLLAERANKRALKEYILLGMTVGEITHLTLE